MKSTKCGQIFLVVIKSHKANHHTLDKRLFQIVDVINRCAVSGCYQSEFDRLRLRDYKVHLVHGILNLINPEMDTGHKVILMYW